MNICNVAYFKFSESFDICREQSTVTTWFKVLFIVLPGLWDVGPLTSAGLDNFSKISKMSLTNIYQHSSVFIYL